MNLRQIEMFRAVMQTGSFTAAAQALHISQPGVSRAARHLELQLGVPLFERSQGRIRPTDEAIALNAEIERSYRGVQSIQQFARALKHGTYAMLRVACSPNIGAHAVPRALASLLATSPNASVSFEVLPRAQQLIDALLSEQLDLGFSSIALEHPMLQTRAIGHWELVCLFRRGHPLARKTAVTPGDLAGESFVAFHVDTQQGRMVGEWLQGSKVVVTARALIRSGQAAAALVASGVGIAFVDNMTAVAAEALDLEWRPIRKSPRVPIQAVWSRHHAPSQQAMRLCKLVQQELTAAR
jgi:DNA-binding transcriptional LysR family regulator